MTTSAHGSSRTILAGIVGNILEWYDFALFAFFAPTIAALFFPGENRIASLLNTFGIFALGFLMRPVGGMVFGHIGDRIGRKKALEWSVLLMAIPTTIMGCLPTYDQAGLLEPILLTVLRMLQGLSVGGEFIGSMSFLGEHAPPHRRGFFASWSSFGGGFGNLLGCGGAFLTTAAFSNETLLAWGWRVPFLGGLLVGFVGLWLRVGVAESPSFQEVQAKGEVVHAPTLETFRRDGRSLLITLGLAMMLGVGFYLPWVWLPTWLAHINEPPIDADDALRINTIAMFGMTLLIPVGGLISDFVGRRRMILLMCATYAVLVYPLFSIVADGRVQSVWHVQLTMALLSGLLYGPIPAALVEVFPTRTRYSGIGVAYNVCQAVFGGTTPYVATWLIEQTGNTLAPVYYLIAACVLTALASLFMTDRTGQPL